MCTASDGTHARCIETHQHAVAPADDTTTSNNTETYSVAALMWFNWKGSLVLLQQPCQ